MLRTRKSWTSIFETPAPGRRSDAGPPKPLESEPVSVLTGSRVNPCDRLEQRWYANAATPARERPKCATGEEVDAFEQRNGVKLPADLREYFQRLNGIDMDAGLFRFWPLARLISLKLPPSVLGEADRYFLFADYMVGTWYYAIYLGDDPFLQNRVILPDFPSHPVIAPNFSEFVELYLTDSPRLYGNQ